MNYEEYEAIDAISRTELWEFNRCPETYWHKYFGLNLAARKATPAMQWGIDVEHALEHGGMMPSNIRIIPDDVLAKNGARAGNAYLDWAAENAGYRCMKQEEYNRFRLEMVQVFEQVRDHALASELLFTVSTKWQVPVQWNCPQTGLPLKALIDAWKPSDVVADVKTTNDISKDAFRRSCHKFGYLWQAAHYLQGAQSLLQKFFFVVIESSFPYRVEVYEPSDMQLDTAYHELLTAKERYRDYLERGTADVWRSPTHGESSSLDDTPVLLGVEEVV